ncbi:MAG: hypothetical protein ACON4O_02800 [Lentimonas sp.]
MAKTDNPIFQKLGRDRVVCAGMLCLIGATGCVSIKTEHRVKPIHITMDVNVRLERELDDAFAELDAKAVEIAEEKGLE